jgi:hypothetical protein
MDLAVEVIYAGPEVFSLAPKVNYGAVEVL